MRQLKIIGILLALLLLFLVIDGLHHSKQPSYNGKTVSEWLVELHEKPSQTEISAALDKELHGEQDAVGHLYDQKRASDEKSIRQFGATAIPTLIEILGVTEHTRGKVLFHLQNKDLLSYALPQANLDDLQRLAVDGFAILGTSADSAVPQLTNLFDDPETRFEAARALTKVGPRGFAFLTNAFHDPDSSVRNTAIWVVGEEGGGDPKIVMQLLLGALKDADPMNRGNAADFLAHRDASVVVPALIGVLDDKEYYPKERAIGSLGSYGVAASNAVPKLQAMYHLKDELAPSIADALKQIMVERKLPKAAANPPQGFGAWRLPAVSEMEELLHLGLRAKPETSRIAADIYSEGQYVIKPGMRTRHVQEWISGGHYRRDETDESSSEFTNWPAGETNYLSTYVSLHDTNLSPYTGYEMRRSVKKLLVFKDPRHEYSQDDLWEAGGIEETAVYPLVYAFAVEESHIFSRDIRSNPAGIRTNALALEQLHGGTNGDWVCGVSDGTMDALPVTCLRLEGGYLVDHMNFCSMIATYYIAHISNQPVCVEFTLSNLTAHSTYSSRREHFDESGFPASWTTIDRDANGKVKSRRVVFKKIEMNPDFDEREAFVPKFPPDYWVDEFDGSPRGVRLQEPPQRTAGIGVRLDEDKTTREIRIAGVFPNLPAAEAGLTTNLVLLKINNRATDGLTLPTCIRLIRGDPGTKVRLELRSADGTKTNNFELIRQAMSQTTGLPMPRTNSPISGQTNSPPPSAHSP